METRLFHMDSNRGLIDDWNDKPHRSFTGLILPDAELYALHGKFGNIVFQHIARPKFDIWFSIYKILQRIITHSTLDYRSIELSLMVKSSISYNLKPFGQMRQEEMQVSIAHTLSMDAKVLFEKDLEYITCDIHYKEDALLILMEYMPELVYPFLNEYYAGRESIIGKLPLYANEHIFTTFRLFFSQLNDINRFSFSVDNLGIMLLGYVFLWYAEVTQRRGLTKRQEEIRSTLNLIKQMLQSNHARFEGISHYARIAGMSNTAFKNSFTKEFGMAPHRFWESERLTEAVRMLLSSGEPIKNIAVALGFADTHAMDKAFKQKFKQTPSEYRFNHGLD